MALLMAYGKGYVGGRCGEITGGMGGQSTWPLIDPGECAGGGKARSPPRRQRGDVPAHVPDKKRFGSRPEARLALQNHRATRRVLDRHMIDEQRGVITRYEPAPENKTAGGLAIGTLASTAAHADMVHLGWRAPQKCEPDPRAWRPRRVHAPHDDGSRCGALRPQRSRPILAERQPRGIGEQHGRACFDRESSPNRKPAVHHVWRLSEGPRLARRDRQGVAPWGWAPPLAATERQHPSAGYERGSHSEGYTATRRAEPQEEGGRRCCHCRMQSGPPKRRA